MDEWLLERELMPLPSVPQNDHWYNATCAQLKLSKVSSGSPVDAYGQNRKMYHSGYSSHTTNENWYSSRVSQKWSLARCRR